MRFSLYVHIPYCQSKCPYCDFNSHAASSWPEEDYIRALIAELEARAVEPPWHGAQVATVFFGGGTPSLFAPRSIGRVIDAAAGRFGIEADAEITLEANPGTVEEAKLVGMRLAGVNRLSLGAQSFNARTLALLGRIHCAAQTRAAARMAHRAGFERLNLDLMFAVPGQSIDEVLSDIDQAVALEPDHVSAYNLTFEQGTAFFTELKHGRIKQLSDDEQAAMYAAVRSRLPERGYPMYEISNYAPAGHEARHNLTYWCAESYLGLGAGAHSFAQCGRGGRRWWNERGPSAYLQMALGGGRAEAGAEAIDERLATGEYVFLNLRLRRGFALEEFQSRFGVSFLSLFGGPAARLFEGGLLLRENGRIRLSERGLELADSVFAEFVQPSGRD